MALGLVSLFKYKRCYLFFFFCPFIAENEMTCKYALGDTGKFYLGDNFKVVRGINKIESKNFFAFFFFFSENTLIITIKYL